MPLVLMALLALVVAAIGRLIFFDGGDDEADGATLPPGVEQAIDEFVTAFEEADTARFEAIITDDFREVTSLHRRGIGSEEGQVLTDGVFSEGINKMRVRFSELRENNSSWDIEQVGDPLVSGDGPWFVSFEETWTQCSLLDPQTMECAAIIEYPDGTATYAVIEENGVYRIAAHVWVGRIELEGTPSSQ